MKKRKLIKYSLVAIAIVIFLVSAAMLVVLCSRFIGKEENDIIVKDNVSTITSDTPIEKRPIEINTNELVFDYNPGYSEGDVIVSGIIKGAPNGFIRIVESVEKEDGEYIVKTENGALTDVFDKATISKTFLLSNGEATEYKQEDMSQAYGISVMPSLLCANPAASLFTDPLLLTTVPMSLLENDTDYQFAKEFLFDFGDGIVAQGEVGFNLLVEVVIDINWGEIEFEVIVHSETGGEIFVGLNSEKKKEFEKELLSKDLPNIQFVVAGIPIIITNELTANIEGEAKIKGEMGISVAINATNRNGFKYSSTTNSIEEIKESEYISDGIEWNTEAKVSGECSIGVMLHLVTKLYDSTGADISVGLAGTIEGEVKAFPKQETGELEYVGNLNMSIGPKIQGSIVVSIPIIDKKLVDKPIFEVELDPFWEKHWDSGENWEQDLELLELEETKQEEEEIIIEDSDEQIWLPYWLEVDDLLGEWTGDYFDALDWGKATLTITDITKDGQVKAIYHVDSEKEKEWKSEGFDYKMSCSYHAIGTIDFEKLIMKLEFEEWIDKPDYIYHEVFYEITIVFVVGDEVLMEGLGHESAILNLKKNTQEESE